MVLLCFVNSYWMVFCDLTTNYINELASAIKIAAYFDILRAMAWSLRCSILNLGVPSSKPLGGFKVDSDFYPSKVDKMSTRNF